MIRRRLLACVALALVLEGGSEPAGAASRGLESETIPVAVVEWNTFGRGGNERTAVIFRDSDGNILDWRWMTAALVPVYGRMQWSEGGQLINVKPGRMIETRTVHDVELHERHWLPERQRRKLR